MSTGSPLLIDLAGIARLADVRRPVASVWRTRFAVAADPFPRPVSRNGSRAFFDVMSVAQWLARTEHGNNPAVVADAAASAAPADFDFADESHVAAVDALLALRAASGQPVAGSSRDELQRRAVVVDPDDSCLATEISAAHTSWAEWADLLADAAYSPFQASQLLERRHRATTASAGSSGPLTSDAEALLLALAEALTLGRQTELVVGGAVTPRLVSELLSHRGEEVEVVVSPLPAGRGIRRRLLCDGIVLQERPAPSSEPRLFIERFPSGNARHTIEMLKAVDELVLGMRHHDRAIVLAPAAMLIERIAPAELLARTDAMRSGRVRAIVKLPTGLATAAPREALALWVLGRELSEVPVAERFTAVADLTDSALTQASRADLTSDVLAAMGSTLDVRAHAFRFTRMVRTTSLLAARGALVVGVHAPIAARSTQDLPALLDQALAGLGEDAPQSTLAVVSSPSGLHPAMQTARLEELIAARHIRMLPGTRVKPAEISESGLVMVSGEDLDDPTHIGDRRVDPLVFAAGHPSARLTVAGDVVFRTAPSAKAWVDPDGSKVVVYPARVLRIDAADPGGLVPELVAADIDRAAGGPAAWRRWRLRRVAPHVTKPLRVALSELATTREALARRITALDNYAELLTAGVVSGAVALTNHAAHAASES